VNHEDALTLVRGQFIESARVLSEVGESCAEFVVESARMVEDTLRGGGRFFTCGNGGSAADAQHIAAELSGRFYLDRPGLAALALSVNTSSLTAVANNFAYEDVFSRQLEGVAGAGDVLLAITTSGRSPNVVKAVTKAHELGMKVIGFTGASGAAFADRCDRSLVVPSKDVARIQEAHICAGHLICQLVETAMFGGQTG
jgi:D-sedoheptulose 7-phosphate isomerase